MSNFDERNRKTGLSQLLMESSKGLNATAVCAKITDNYLPAQATYLKDIKEFESSRATEIYKNINAADLKAEILNPAKAIGMTDSTAKGLAAASYAAATAIDATNQLSAQAAYLKDIKEFESSRATEIYKNINAADLKAEILNPAKAIGMTDSTAKGLAAENYSAVSAIDAMKLSPAELKMPNIHRLIPNIPDLYDSLKRDKKGTALQLTSMEYKDFLLMLKEENWISPEYYELFYMSDKIRKRRLILAICKKKIKFQVRTDNENMASRNR